MHWIVPLYFFVILWVFVVEYRTVSLGYGFRVLGISFLWLVGFLYVLFILYSAR